MNTITLERTISSKPSNPFKRFFAALIVTFSSSLILAEEGHPQASDEGVTKGHMATQAIQPMSEAQIDAVRQFLEESIPNLESELGLFHDELADKIFQLGLVYQVQADYENAVNMFERSLHIKKINGGLYHESHFPIVERLIQTHRLTGKWKTVDQLYDYLNWLYLRVYGETSPNRLSILNKLILWKVEAINGQITDNREGMLNEALTAARQATRILDLYPDINAEDVLVFSENDLKRALRGTPQRQ